MLELFCTVCREPLSPELIRKKANAHPGECKNRVRAIRRALRKSAERCPTCGQKVRQDESARVRRISQTSIGLQQEPLRTTARCLTAAIREKTCCPKPA